MITYIKGDLFESPAKVLVNTVNTVGVMGKGIAKKFKTIYPEMFQEYQKLCEKNELNIGNLWLYKTNNKWILNFPTKKHWRNPSKLEYIEKGLKKFADNYEELGISSIAFPPPGCGNGELDWDSQVGPLMKKYLNNLPIEIFIYLNFKNGPSVPEHKNIREIKKWLRSEPGSLGFIEVWKDIKNKIEVNQSVEDIVNGNTYHCRMIKHHTNNGDDNDTIDTIEITTGNTTEYLTEDDWQYIWSNIRDYGFLNKKKTPNYIRKLYGFIISFLKQFNYCKVTALTNSYSEEPELTIQLDPVEASGSYSTKQLELFG